MKFKKKYINAKYMEQFDVEGDTIVKGKRLHSCSICEELTDFYSLSFGAYYCSEKCLKKEWDNYIEALR